jgi:predicted RNA-binding protein YlxR (DUF448 family)
MVVAEQIREHDEGTAPERTCVGCRAHAERADLLRFVHVPGNEPPLVPDFGARLAGRGVWVHPRGACLKRAVRGGFARALRQSVDVDFAGLAAIACGQVERRLRGLLLAAQRRRAVALGTDAVRLALGAVPRAVLDGSRAAPRAVLDGSRAAPRASTAPCAVHLLLVAKDAAGRRADLVSQAAERNVPVIELCTKDELGHLTGKDSLGFIAVLDVQIAREIADSARWLAGLSEDG